MKKMINNKYEFKELVYDKYAIWYKEIQKKGNKIGVYKIIDAASGIRETRFAFRYKPREGQTQEQSDSLIISRAIHNFYKPKNTIKFRGDRGYENA